eukprot:478166-Prorocentrum_minimum.AAC.1
MKRLSQDVLQGLNGLAVPTQELVYVWYAPQRAALNLDKKCMDMVEGQKTLEHLENHGTTGLPYGWKRDTLQTVDQAEAVKRQATKLRKICFTQTHKRQ